IGCGIERRHGRPAESSLLQSALPVKRPPEGAGPEESADGQALLELLDHVSPILTDVARVVVLPSVLGIDDWLERRRDLGLREPHHGIEFPEQVPCLSTRVDDTRDQRPLEYFRRGRRELGLPTPGFPRTSSGRLAPSAARMARALSSSN